MAFGTLQGIELPAPSSFSEGREVVGGYNTTLAGAKRRYIKAIKKNWKLSYDILSVDTYNEIIAVYNTLETFGLQESQPSFVFTLEDTNFGVAAEDVHMDISDRQFIPGTNLLSSVQITLQQL
jgi:hypothetical protein